VTKQARTAWLVHGIFSRGSGATSIDRLGPFFRAAGWRIAQVDYGVRGPLGAFILNDDVARGLAMDAGPDDVVIDHSNGAAVGQRASLEPGARFQRMIHISGALDVDAVPGPAVRRCWVCHSPDDGVLAAARYVPRWLGGALWGAQGRDGYRGDDPRMINLNLHDVLGVSTLGHGGMFARELIGKLGPALTAAAGQPLDP